MRGSAQSEDDAARMMLLAMDLSEGWKQASPAERRGAAALANGERFDA